MVASWTVDSAVQALGSADSAERLAAVRYIKNAAIGNNTKKALFLEHGVHERLVGMLQTSPPCDDECAVQALSALGSFAAGTQTLASKVTEQPDTLRGVVACLTWSNRKVVLAAVRTLNAMCRWEGASTSVLWDKDEGRPGDDVDPIIVGLARSVLNSPEDPLAAATASIIARTCTSKPRKALLDEKGIIHSLINLLEARSIKSQEAGLDALATITHEDPGIVSRFESAEWTRRDSSQTSPLSMLYNFLKDKRPRVRLLACSTLVNIHRVTPSTQEKRIKVSVLPAIIKLVSCQDHQIQAAAPLVLAYLVESDEGLQKAACEGDVVTRLVPLIGIKANASASRGGSGTANTSSVVTTSTAPAVTPASSTGTGLGSWDPHADGDGSEGGGVDERTTILMANALKALAAVCALREDSRRVVIDAGVLPRLVALLEHPDTRVRVMACRCARSLSRSVKNLRTSLVDAGIAPPLLKLLVDESTEVQIYATATLCNIVLEFSPMKKSVVEGGAVCRLVELTTAMHDALRLNATWALKNLLFVSLPPLKATVMRELTWDRLFALMDDELLDVQEQALTLLRNLVCGKEPEINNVFQSAGPALLPAIEKKLSSPAANIQLQALYVVCNLATGSDQHKHSVMTDTVIRKITEHMSSTSALVRTAAIWCVINLIWRNVEDESDKTTSDAAHAEREAIITRSGIYDKLVGMKGDVDPEVRQRVDVALKLFSNSGSGSGGGGQGGGSSGGPMDTSSMF